MLVAPSGRTAKRLGVILLAFSTVDTLTAFAARPIPGRTAIRPLRASALFFHALPALMTFLTVLTLLAVSAIAVFVTRTARFAFSFRRWR